MIPKGYKKSFKLAKRKFHYKKILTILVLAGIVSGAAYLFLFSAHFKIKEISITSKEISKEDIRRAVNSQIEVKKNIFFANVGRAAEILKNQFPKIATVQIKKSFPNKIVINIEERKSIAILEYNNEHFNIDKEGVAFGKVPEQLIVPPIIKIQPLNYDLKEGEEVFSPEIAGEIATIIDKFNNNLKIEIEIIDIVSDYRVNLKINEGWEAYLSFNDDIAWQLEKLNTLLKEKIPLASRKNLKYIDLRFEKIYVYPEISALQDPAEK